MSHLDVLDIPFALLRKTGLWQDSAASWWYRVFGISLILLFNVAAIMSSGFYLVETHSNENLKEFSDAISIFAFVFAFNLKLFWFHKNLGNVKVMKQTLEKILEKQTREENAISRKKHEKRLKLVVYICFASMLVTFFVSAITAIANLGTKPLLVKTALAWDHRESFWIYWFTFAYQLIASIFTTLANCSLDVIPIIFMSFTSISIEELSSELSIANSEYSVKECVERHIEIKSFASKISKNLSMTFLIQATMSSVVLCTLVFYLATVRTKR
jgi:uncharacterized membrane protein